MPGTRLYPAVPALLAGLRQRGVRLGIVSSKLRSRILAILKQRGSPARSTSSSARRM